MYKFHKILIKTIQLIERTSLSVAYGLYRETDEQKDGWTPNGRTDEQTGVALNSLAIVMAGPYKGKIQPTYKMGATIYSEKTTT